jgi:hypothetical protein
MQDMQVVRVQSCAWKTTNEFKTPQEMWEKKRLEYEFTKGKETNFHISIF